MGVVKRQRPAGRGLRDTMARRWRAAMADALLMDRMFQRIMRGLVDTGRAPHHAELARALGLGCEEGRLLLHDVMRAYPIGTGSPCAASSAGSPSAGSRRPRPPGSFPVRRVRVDAPCLVTHDAGRVDPQDPA